MLCLLFAAHSIHAQIAYQGFEQNASDTWGVTFSTPACTNGADTWNYVSSVGTGASAIAPSAGSAFWGVRDLTGNCGGSAGETLQFATVSVAGLVSITVAFDYAVHQFDSGDDIFYTLYLDGVAQPQVQLVNGFSNFSTGGYLTETLNIPNGTNTVRLDVLVDQNGDGDWAGLDNFIVAGTPGVTCTQTVARFAPDRGPVGTDVRISGTGFTASSTVEFNGVAATNVIFVSSTELIVTVPNGAMTGDLVVIENSCPIVAGTFDVLSASTSCGANFSDLVISEVYDETSGSLGYIEVFNGTNAAIDLTQYKIDRYPSLTSTTATYSYTFPSSGTGSTIASGQALVGRITSGTGAEDFTFTGSTSGFNDEDRLELVFIPTNTVVDDFHEDVVNARGFIYRRNTNITGPNPSYTTSEWTTGTAGDLSNLGTYNVAVGGTAPTITTQPVDVTACGVDITVVAAPGSGGTLTYQWFFHPGDDTTTGWAPVTAAAFSSAVVTGENTDNLQIQGNMTDYDNYQFYVRVVENGTCPTLTEAVQFDLTTGRYFRSTRSGNWTDHTLWEVANAPSGPWGQTCTYPTADNSDGINILNTHEVTVNQDLIVDQLVIEFVGEVIIPNARSLTINDGTGIDLTINGILTDNGNGGANGLRFANATATWIYGTAGEVVKTGSSSVVQYREHYQNGISFVPTTATWRYRYIGPSSPTVSVATVSMFYPNLYFESTNGDYSFSGFSELFKGGSGFVTVKGNLFIGVTGTGGVDVYNTNTNANPMQIQGDLRIGSTTVNRPSTFENNFNGTIGTGIEVLGDIVISEVGQLDFGDGTTAPDGVIRLHGDWNNMNSGNGFTEGQSTVHFVGGALQTISRASAAGNENFHNVVINKPSGFLLNNASNMVVENDMNFTRGILQTSTTNLVYFEAAATATGASNISYVEGPVGRQMLNGQSNNFIFPTGNNNIYGPIGVQTRFHLGQDFVARYRNNGYGDYTINTNELDHVSSIEYWDLDKLNGNLAENLEVTLFWGPHSRVITPNSIRVAHYMTQAPNTTDQWEREGNSPSITGTATNGSVTSDWVTSFSPFTLGDITAQRSLPLNLLSFKAKKVERSAVITWEVANEQAGDRYCLQRSSDAQNFENIACFDASDNKNLAAYAYTDDQPLYGYNYYRIHQVDAAGESDYSMTKVLDFGEANPNVQVFPNPTRGELFLSLPVVEGDYQLRVVNALGQTVFSTNKSGLNSTQQLDLSELAAGNYLLSIEGPEGSQTLKKITITK